MTVLQRMLGNTGIAVSTIGLGTVKFGRNQEVKYPANFAIPEDAQIKSLLDLTRDLGINLLDTAPAYGSSEQRLGRLLQDRQDRVLCTKVGEEFLNGKSVYDFSHDHVLMSINRSLRYLATDYLDIVLIHSDGRDEFILENSGCVAALRKLKEDGKIRAIGMSTKTVAGGLKALELLDVVMVTYNPSLPDDLKVIQRATELNKGVLIKKALNSGHDCVNGSPEDNLRFALAPEGVSSVIVGTINAGHLKANAAAVANI